MSEETKVVLNHLLEYLQDKIDTGYHKIFYNDDMHDEKTIDCINAINNTLEEIERLHSIIKEVREILKFHLSNPSGTKNGWHIDIWNSEDINKLNEHLEILDKEKE